MAPTIKDVAARAGVSIATVSRTFADASTVSADLRDRVAAAAGALKYQPSRVARNLRAGTSQTVGVVIPDLQNPFFTGIVRGLENVLLAAGYSLLLANSDEDPTRERQMLDTLRAEAVAGLIFVPINAGKSSYLHLLVPQLPIVAVDRLPVDLRVDLVTVANAAGSRAAVQHLLQLGHRRVALLGGPSKHSTAVQRERGYITALQRAGMAVRAERIFRGDFREQGGYDGMNALMAAAKPPTAVFVANNLMTLGALRALHEAGCEIPGDVALVGFDDMPWATSLNPPLTAVAQPEAEIGRSAAELLLGRIADPDRPVRHVVLEATLVVRASCGAPLARRA
ncbi:MAG: LacI family transcriptional regulator [Acidobacteria bacterium]|nr:LacI family transcriptional regulator [Acidobacteriota bacterium]